MKQVLKKVALIPLLGITLATNISANKSNWAGMNLSSDDINNSVHFQLVRGSTCVGEFDKLRPVLDRFISEKNDISYIPNLLGKPSKLVSLNSQEQHLYYLTANSNNCILKLSTQNGNLISYTIESCK